MLRALVVSFAMLAVSPGPLRGRNNSAGRQLRNAIRHDVSNKQPAPQSNSAAESSSGEDSAAENELLEAANKSRELAGVPPLRMDESLREAALAHARRMVASERLEHQFSGEPSLLERIAQVTLRIRRAH